MKAKAVLLIGFILLVGWVGTAKQITNTVVPTSTTEMSSVEPTVPPTTAVTLVPEAPVLASIPTLQPTQIPVHVEKEDFKNEDVFLEVPKIEINARVEMADTIEGDDGLSFSKPEENPLWVPDWSRDIGLEGVALIYGHRQWGPLPKVFTDLDDLEPGDEVVVTTAEERFVFEVVESIVIDPEDLWKTISEYDAQAQEQADAQLALLTCTPWGTDWQRLVVFATLVRVEGGK